MFVLESIYYAAVVVLEVPSGYLSDRLGRRPTLIIAAAATTAAHVVFATSGSFPAFAVGQCLLAAGMAFNSGTDSALLYDSLQAQGRPDEFGSIEGRAQAWGLITMAVASAVGGLSAGFDLRLAYVLSGVAGFDRGWASRWRSSSRAAVMSLLVPRGFSCRRSANA